MRKVLLVLLCLLPLVGCSPTPAPQVIEAFVAQTVASIPTWTPYPTYTPLPTLEPLPTYTPVPPHPTHTPLPTYTPVPPYPTYTPLATYTPYPTYTPVPPTATPTVTETPFPSPTDTDTPLPTATFTPQATPTPALGTKSRPYPYGQAVTISRNGVVYTMRIANHLRGEQAMQKLRADNMFNAPLRDMEYLLIFVEVDYSKGPADKARNFTAWDFTSVTNNRIFAQPAVVVGGELQGSCFAPCKANGWVALAVFPDDKAPLARYQIATGEYIFLRATP